MHTASAPTSSVMCLICQPRCPKSGPEHGLGSGKAALNPLDSRFDKEASKADPAHLSATARGSFDLVYDSLECFVNDQGLTQWPSKGTIDMQMDNTNKMTFGYGSIGIFDDHSADSQFGDLKPHPPLTGGMGC
ncbi:hypothetical protein KC361_g4196 [Hortaea werneckii]|nr:hypothetical protein KC361_g4196 [Hortaea werneckii]